MNINQAQDQAAPAGWRFKAGLFFFVLGWICPLFIPLVTNSSLPAEAKALLSGGLLIGGLELYSVILLIFLRIPDFNYIKSKIFAFFKQVAPHGRVSRTRYRIGLVMLLLHVINANLIAYAPNLIPGYLENRIIFGIVTDILFLITLYVLGGDFGDKLGAVSK